MAEHRYCELVANESGPAPVARRDHPLAGRCSGPPAAVRLSGGFSDVVCVWHGKHAELTEPGARVVWP